VGSHTLIQLWVCLRTKWVGILRAFHALARKVGLPARVHGNI
jgi:hypothetical protein